MALQYERLLIAEYGQELEIPYPADYTDLLQQALFYYRRYFLPLLAVALIIGIVNVPTGILAELMSPFPTGGDIAALFLLSIPQYIAYWLAQGAQIWLIGSAVVGRTAGFIEAWKAVLSRFFAYLLTSLLGLILVLPGICCCFLGIMFTFTLFAAFLPQVILLTGSSYFSALVEHFQMVVRGRWLRVAGFVMATGLLVYAVLILLYPAIIAPQLLSYILSEVVPLPLEWMARIFGHLWSQFSAAIVLSYFNVFLTLLFFDLRARSDGLDLELLLNRFDGWASEK